MSWIFLFACETGPDYGAFGSAIRVQKKTLERDRCNEQSVVELSGLLEKAGHLSEGSDTMAAYATACTPTAQFERLHLEYAQRIEDWPQVLAILDKRVLAEPSSTSLRSQRAKARAGSGDIPGAIADRRQQVLLEARSSLPAALKELALLQERAKEPCEAWLTWRTLSRTSRELKGEAQIGMAKILNEPTCRHLVVTTSSELVRQDIAGWWAFPVSLDGKETHLGADTSSVISVVSRAEAVRLGLPTEGEPWLLRSFQGVVAGPIVRVRELRIGEVVVPEVDVAIVDSVPDNVPGMLGGDVLSRIRLEEVSGKRWKVEPHN